MTDTAASGDADTRTLRRIELATAVLLSMAGLITAWASYQAALWGGIQASHYAQGAAKTTEASRLSIIDGQLAGADTMMFMAWLDAAAERDQRRMIFFERRFSPEMRQKFEPWRARHPGDLRNSPVDAAAPAALPRPVHAEGLAARRLQRQSATEFAAGDSANGHGDRFVATTVVLSTVLFLGGISPLLRRNRVRIAVLLLAAALGIAATLFMLTLPTAGL